MKSSDEKLRNFQKILKKQGIGAFAVMDIASVNYLADYKFMGQSDAFLLVTPSQAWCFTKELYAITLRRAAPFFKCVNSLNPADIAAKVKEFKIKSAAFDPGLIDYISGNMFKAAGFKELPGIVAAAREIKLPSEIAKIRKACRISAKAYEIFRRKLKTGLTETAAARMLEDIMYSLGATGLAFPTVMAFGPNGANPHHANGERKLKAEDAVLMDYGCTYQGYCSDITRSFWHGKKPAKEFTKIYDIVKAAHDEVIKKAKPGMSGEELDAVARNYMEKAGGFAKYFIHTTGHGLGIEIHEAPRVGMKSKQILKTGMVFTDEPGLYFEGKLGVRYENTVLLTKRGAKILTVGE
ncbi:MAG: aminopeptidase P family protein [Elusimicrobiota bacterium]|jgi:Xaa-Pro aminopeptidase|nr:aminopeptidase P family protein [Elusimicrobiota bacterium]